LGYSFCVDILELVVVGFEKFSYPVKIELDFFSGMVPNFERNVSKSPSILISLSIIIPQ